MGKHVGRPYNRVVPRATPLRQFTKVLASFGEVADPLARLDAVRRAREDLEALEARTVAAARADGATWGEIGALYGVSKQAAQQRFRLKGKAKGTR
jgi:hypothetical protein